MNPILDVNSQSAIHSCLEEGRVSHSTEARISLPIEVCGEGVVRFPISSRIVIEETLKEGDGNALPESVFIYHLPDKLVGKVRVNNARVIVNGGVHIIVDRASALAVD